MRNILILALTAPIALMGCNPSDGGGGSGGGGSFSKTPSFEITSDNRAMVDEFALEAVVGVESAYSEFLFDEWDDFSVNISKQAARLLERQSVSGRSINESETYDCDSGTASFSVTASGISDEGDISASGNIAIEIKANNCREEWWGDEYDITNGTMLFTISWSGYNDATETFSNLDFSIKMTNYSFYEYEGDDLIYFEEVDGELTSSLSGTNYSNSLDVFFRGTELDGKGVKAETLSAITGSTDDERPTAGEWIIRGGGGTTARYTIVANGIEVRLNDGQPELLTWEYIDENYSSDGWDDW